MAVATDQKASRRRSHLAAVAIVGLALSGLSAAPAVAMPASVPSVNYNIGDGAARSGWNYGERAPSARSLIIGSETRQLTLTMPFRPFDQLSCTLTDANGGYISGQTTPRDDENEGFAIGHLSVPAGRVVAGSEATFMAECVDGFVNLVIARFLLTEGPGVGVSASYPGSDAKLVSSAKAMSFGPNIFEQYGATGSGQTVVPGNRVRLYGAAGTFRIVGRTNKATVTLRSGSTTVNGLDVNIISDGSILGFTVPAGLAAGRVDLTVKTVSTLAGTPTTPKSDLVSNWNDYAIYDPNLDGRSFTISPFPTVTGRELYPATMTANVGNWQPTPTSFTHRWSRDGVIIPGATSSTYRTVAADSGHHLTVSVTSVKSGLRSATRTSLPLRIYG